MPLSNHPVLIACLMLLPALLLPVFLYLLSWAGGWSRLARECPVRPRSPGTSGSFASVLLGRWCGYNNCVGWHADAEHLHLTLPLILSMWHPPLSIPWGRFENLEPAGRIGVKGKGWVAIIAGVRVTLPEKLVAQEITRRGMQLRG